MRLFGRGHSVPDEFPSIVQFRNQRVAAKLEPVEDSWAVKSLWGGLQGQTYVIISSWDHQRCLDDLKARGVDVPEPVLELALREVTREGRYMVQGDVIALEYIRQTLTSLYDPEAVHYVDPAGQGLDYDSPEIEGIRSGNIVILCGPEGNPLGRQFLRDLGLDWLFPPKSDPDPNRIRTGPRSDHWLTPKGGPPPEPLRQDHGVFFRVPSPFPQGKGKFIFGIMGAYAWGTQIAAAASCSCRAAREIIDSQKYLDLPGWPAQDHVIAWLQVQKGAGEELAPLRWFMDRECFYGVCHPLAPSRRRPELVHRNYADVASSHSSLLVDSGRVKVPMRMMRTVVGTTIGLAVLAAGCVPVLLGELLAAKLIGWIAVLIGAGLAVVSLPTFQDH